MPSTANAFEWCQRGNHFYSGLFHWCASFHLFSSSLYCFYSTETKKVALMESIKKCFINFMCWAKNTFCPDPIKYVSIMQMRQIFGSVYERISATFVCHTRKKMSAESLIGSKKRYVASFFPGELMMIIFLRAKHALKFYIRNLFSNDSNLITLCALLGAQPFKFSLHVFKCCDNIKNT